MRPGKRGQVVGILKHTHDAMDRELVRFEAALVGLRFEGKHSVGKNLGTLKRCLEFFEERFLQHMQVEERSLFPLLIQASPMLEPCVALLKSEHHELRLCLKRLRALFKSVSGRSVSAKRRLGLIQSFKEQGRYFAELLRTHVREEIVSVYRLAGRLLPRRLAVLGE